MLTLRALFLRRCQRAIDNNTKNRDNILISSDEYIADAGRFSESARGADAPHRPALNFCVIVLNMRGVLMLAAKRYVKDVLRALCDLPLHALRGARGRRGAALHAHRSGRRGGFLRAWNSF